MLFKKSKNDQLNSKNELIASMFIEPIILEKLGITFEDILDLYFYEDKVILLLNKGNSNLDIVSIINDNIENIVSIEKPHLESFWPIIRVTSNKDFIIVNRRCRRVTDTEIEKNALIYNKEGKLLTSFTLGDGITDIVPFDCSLLVGYFDEGVFGNYGWETPIGQSGLVTFDLNGNILSEYTALNKKEYIYDVYCMNKLHNGDVWLYFYGPNNYLIKIDRSKRTKYELKYVSGIGDFSIDENIILTTSGYERSNKYYLGNLQKNSLLKVIEFYDSFNKEIIIPEKTFSFDDKLFLLTKENLYIILVSDVYTTTETF